MNGWDEMDQWKRVHRKVVMFWVGIVVFNAVVWLGLGWTAVHFIRKWW